MGNDLLVVRRYLCRFDWRSMTNRSLLVSFRLALNDHKISTWLIVFFRSKGVAMLIFKRYNIICRLCKNLLVVER